MSLQPIKSSFATLQLGVSRSDGRISVFDNEVYWEPQNKDFGLGPYRLPRKDVISVSRKNIGTPEKPVYTEAFQLCLKNDDIYEFILCESENWVKLLTSGETTK